MKNIKYKRKSYFKNKLFVLLIVVNLVLLLSVANLMNYTQGLLNDDTRLNLTEIVTQNKNVITSKLKLEINNLNMNAENLAREYEKSAIMSNRNIKNTFLNYTEDKKESMIFLALNDGKAIFPDGEELDISGRAYYRLAIEGTQNISDKIVSGLNGTDIFVISVPFYLRDKIVGTIQKIYTIEEMYEICSISLFSEQGHMCIINNQGNVLISSQLREYEGKSDNYFRMLLTDNKTQASELETNIKANKSGFMEIVLNGEKNFSAYTPIEEVHEWYLISSVPVDAVSSNSSAVIKMFYVVLFGVVLIFALSMIYFFNFKNKQQANLKNLAFVDRVTGGNTHTKFLVEVKEIMERDTQSVFSVMSFDIDNFKYFNNFYGFEFGDEVLRIVYKKFSRLLNANETMGRLYSDNFVILLKNSTKERMDLFSGMDINLEGVHAVISGGVYQIADRKESSSLMIDKARMAAKSLKGVRFKKIAIYSEEFHRKMIKDENTKRDVEKALADDEIVPYYQPKVDINSGAIVGAEALARWVTKKGEVIPPMEFIPICERSGLISIVDMTIFEKTLIFLKKQLEEGVKCVPISVNFSRFHLQNTAFLDELTTLTERYKVPNELIELELTETAIFENHEVIEELIEKAYLHGLLISMDDFGSGYSSLHMLKDIPIDIIKVDGGFLKGGDDNRKNKVILSAITTMVKELNIKVIVEGVETQENVDLMKEVGAYTAQGYFYSKPLSEEEFEKIWKKGKI